MDSSFAQVLEVRSPSPSKVNEAKTLTDFSGSKI